MGCSGDSKDSGSLNVYSNADRIIQLVKAESIEEANKLLKKGHFIVGVYWNSHLNREEYVLGVPEKDECNVRRMGFRAE